MEFLAQLAYITKLIFKNKYMKRKEFKLLTLLIILIIPVIFLSACSLNNNEVQNEDNREINNQELEEDVVEQVEVMYMSEAEKEDFGIDIEKTVQVLQRDEEGGIMGYKFIESEDDLILSKEEIDELLNPIFTEDENTILEETEDENTILEEVEEEE